MDHRAARALSDARNTLQAVAVWLIVTAGALSALGYYVARGQPVALDDAPERVPCISYTPFRTPGQTPFARDALVDPAQIDADLAVLATRTACVRTYALNYGLAEVPRLARKHGMRVLLGVWIGRDAAANEAEITRALAVLRRDADAIDAVIVGNEVLLRRELAAGALRGYIERVRAATTLPVTYADVWEFWLQHRELVDAVSFVTVHLLPYWEDDPTPVERAVAHTLSVHAAMREQFPGKRVMVGEVGWPSRGRQREGAEPSRVNQARYLRELASAAATHDLFYNVVEAFDQPWKRRLEGTVGGYWGVFDSAGAAKFALRGPVVEDPEWITALLVCALGAIAFIAAAFVLGQRIGRAGAGCLALSGIAWGGLLAAQLRYLAASSRDAVEWLVTGGFIGVSGFASIVAATVIASWLDGGRPTRLQSIEALVAAVRAVPRAHLALDHWLGAARFAVLFGAAVVALLLALDPRYRDFPLALYAGPALGLALLAWIAPARIGAEEKLLARVIACLAPVIFLREGHHNGDALVWIALCLTLALGVWLSSRGDSARQD